MDKVIIYHYTREKKYLGMIKRGLFMPTSPFNSNIKEAEWLKYVTQFSFPVSRLNTCCFFEKNPKNWKEYGLFEFSGGDYLLEISIKDDKEQPILVRDHSFHSPKNYCMSPEEWRERKNRDSKPHLREAWYKSTIPLKDYNNNFICPEILVPFPISLNNIMIIEK